VDGLVVVAAGWLMGNNEDDCRTSGRCAATSLCSSHFIMVEKSSSRDIRVLKDLVSEGGTAGHKMVALREGCRRATSKVDFL
jgi:hypothetical protein